MIPNTHMVGETVVSLAFYSYENTVNNLRTVRNITQNSRVKFV